jgi:hypothetical protein
MGAEVKADFSFRHFKTIGRQDIAQILNKLGVELIFIGACIKAILTEATEDILDMFLVVRDIVRVD